MNYDNIVKLAYTHPDCEGKSIRFISEQLGMNPGSVWRILRRLGIVVRKVLSGKYTGRHARAVNTRVIYVSGRRKPRITQVSPG